MQPYVEHANITVRHLENTIRFLQTAIPEFSVRHQGQQPTYRWCHIGTDATYLALQEVIERDQIDRHPYRDLGINHIGLVVEDILQVRARLLDAGYRENDLETDHPWRKRAYFFDQDGIEWEFIQYLSDDPVQRNDYSL
ncbi:VOC family protein [Photobacterium galatheae]|uniref:Lactoylglutathione lyase n=1 Tax=Photobacterium galatheae TaxID=1654360 RepID=A0A066RSQ0_9GAMM|nr:VOC family protein [Photobacterium galatheae]KDM90428.1 lactoylglutathione lyase [Photobacterium galatheae]MCM0147852.1 VOC family protein [Photobacterium galatheae]